ncbi:MAG: hypothetical protein L6R42_006410 [Xanthoria sp. 1 TBL-2021]|nr:MAG: hypothetical protein L6R42_006410 [Xanthoria sp. 1 TBL-2021]
MAPDNGHQFASKPFSLSTNPPFPTFSTASRADPRQSSRLGWYSPFPSTSSSQLHTRSDSYGHARSDSKDNGSEDKASAMDAKRFTPNLHASLVSEILSLRREIEGKNNALASLEDSLQSSKLENAQLTATVTSQEREIQSAKKQMQLLESGTLSALGDIAKERDDAVGSLADARKRLEASKSSVRGFEEDARRNQALWEQDKQNWDTEKRNIERKVHVAEGRLKTMVNEVAAAQNSSQLASICGSEQEEGAGETWFSNWSDIISTRSSSVRGRYHLSELSNNTYDTNELANLRNSTLAARASLIMTEPNSLSLAAELNFDEALEGHSGDNEMEREIFLPDALPEENLYKIRRLSIQSQDCKARRILGLSTDPAEQALCEEPSVEQPLESVVEQPLRSLQTSMKPLPTRRDMATQYSPPASPKTAAQEPAATSEKDLYRFANTENTANQRRKRISVVAAPHDSFPPRSEQSANCPTASAACQTMPQAASPPLILEPMFPDPGSILASEMMSCSTQTDDASQVADVPASVRDPSSSTAIPVIAIHPPGSRPGSSNNAVMLPPQTKNAACQTEPALMPDVKSIAVQTEGIRVDKRPLQIPPRLMSGAAASKPQSHSDQPSRRTVPKVPKPGLRYPPPTEPSRNSRTRSKPPNIQRAGPHVAQDSDPSGNSGQLSRASPTQMDDLFAGFSDQEGRGMDIDLSDDDDDYANVVPIRKTLSKVKNSWTLVPNSMHASLGPRPLGRPISDIQEIDDTLVVSHIDTQADRDGEVPAPAAGQQGKEEGWALPIESSQKSEIRKAALTSIGALAHLRQRSPSEPGPNTGSSTVPPPFPVPTRSSSRKIPIGSSDGNGSPSPHTTSFIAGIRNRNQARAGSRNPLRKVRSAAAVPKLARTPSKQDETEGESSALPSPTSTSFHRPRIPRTLQAGSTLQQPSALSQALSQDASSSTSNAAGGAVESPSQTTSVVDAIAQTMVGEWLWKYVRKRKSFGMVESAQVEFEEGRRNHENGSVIRHKRWVWLAPYERAVIWSSKQPASGSALMGKGGRKLTIQSVLDVRDDTPMPGMGSAFGRSILILTPQRALKFTAPSQERHYIWLAALSFLSHSTPGIEDLAAIPPLPRAELQPPFSAGGGSGRRSPGDSLRVGKGTDRPALHGRGLTAPVAKGASKAKRVEGFGHDGANESMSDAAEPPQIPRVSAHNRKRSNTGPRPSLQSAFYSFPSNTGGASSGNVKQAAGADLAMSGSRGYAGNSSGPSTTTRRQAETVTVEREAVRNDFFDAVGTVRMEAFVDKRSDGGPGQTRRRNSFRTRQGRKKDMSYWGIQGEGSNASTWRVEDPFRGL